ncbi:MAG TPA: amiloride-sensitive sodium channel family protein [Syntrophaceticus sp.]|nr:amiloride-sensitive sodium channel family protein [Syntrophaceticus sp.]
MNFTTTFVGIFMAIKLDKIFRTWPLREERIELAGHWHILASIIAIALLLYFVDQLNLKGLPRRLFGWTVIIGADLAFAAITVFAMKRLFVSEYMQQPVVNLTMLLSEIGLGVTMVSLALLLVWRLVDLFKADGLWKQELQEADTSSFTGKPASM